MKVSEMLCGSLPTLSFMTKDIVFDVPLVDQRRDTEDSTWKEKACGVCATKMMMAFAVPACIDISVMTLIHEALEIDGYIPNIGWKHAALVQLAERHGVALTFQKNFFRTPVEKKKGVRIVQQHIRQHKPVIVSVHYGFDPNRGGHLVIVHGMRSEGRSVSGYYIQDPYPTQRGNNYFVSEEEFLNGWRGGMILFKE